jgi:dCTP deaminase
MILTGCAIQTAVRQKRITLQPFDPNNLNPNSYNYHLGDTLLVSSSGKIKRQTVQLPQKGYVLRPGQTYLGATLELIGSKRYVTLLLGRSSIGRLGIFLNITADLGHIGSCSHWTLELTVVQPVRVYPKMSIGQVSFWLTDPQSPSLYKGRYHRDTRPAENRDDRVAPRKL